MARVALASPSSAGSITAAGSPAAFNVNVHGARGLLALLVFCFHVASSGLPSFGVFGGAGVPASPLLCLQFGVEIFFCISGTIVVGALSRAASPARFLWDRAMRILPVLWATLAVIVPLGFATHQANYAHYTARDLSWILPANMLVLPGVLPLPMLHMAAWSLSYEMIFYLAAVFFWWGAPRHPMLKRCGVVVAAVLIAWQPRAVFFLIGVLVARSDFSAHPLLGRAVRWPCVWLATFAILWRMATQAGADGGAGSLLPWIQDGRIGLAALGASAALLAWAGIAGGHGLTCTALRTEAAQWLGSVSYSFYLWHLIVLAMLKRMMACSGIVEHLGAWSQLGLFAVGLPASLLVAQASHMMIERQFTAWLKTRRPAIGTMFATRDQAYQREPLTIENTASLAA